MKPVAIAKDTIPGLLKKLNGGQRAKWRVFTSPTDGSTSLQTDLAFKTFAGTWKYLNEVKEHASTLRHHPTITTTYNRVHFEITTHDIGNQLTYLDFELAEKLGNNERILMTDI